MSPNDDARRILILARMRHVDSRARNGVHSLLATVPIGNKMRSEKKSWSFPNVMGVLWMLLLAAIGITLGLVALHTAYRVVTLMM